MSVPSSRVYYLNGAFDLGLRGTVPEQLRRFWAEMTTWFMPVAGPGDRVILDVTVHREYLGYLALTGCTPPRIVSGGSEQEAGEGVPWGWDSEAVERLRGSGASVRHPPFEIVRRVNSRAFSHALGRALGCGVVQSELCESPKQAAAVLQRASTWPLVIKPEFGSAGIDFRLIRSPAEAAKGTTHVTDLLHRGNRFVIIEPWLPRKFDISTRFELDAHGNVSDIRHARAIVSSGGASRGIVYGHDDPLLAAFEEQLDRTAQQVGRALDREGYVGPVNVDSLVTETNGHDSLVPLLEINARQSLSSIAYRVAERLACNAWFMLRAVSAERAILPNTYVELARLLRRADCRPGVRRGALLLTPLSVVENGIIRTPYRAIFFVYGRSDTEVIGLGNRLARCMARYGR